MTSVGTEVRRLRESKGWGQTKLAAEAGMAVSGVSQIENGHRNPNSATLIKLASALEVEVWELFPKDLSLRLPLEERGASTQPRVGSAADGHLRVSGSWKHVEENLSSDQLIEILEGVRNGRITVDTAASRLKPLVKEPA
jgi:transcriptional regulator with XRE-family HTH domain